MPQLNKSSVTYSHANYERSSDIINLSPLLAKKSTCHLCVKQYLSECQNVQKIAFGYWCRTGAKQKGTFR